MDDPQLDEIMADDAEDARLYELAQSMMPAQHILEQLADESEIPPDWWNEESPF